VYYEDDNILIRRYQHHDEAPVKTIFREGMASLIPKFFKEFALPPFFVLSTFGVVWAANFWIVPRLANTAISKKSGSKNTDYAIFVAVSAVSIVFSCLSLHHYVATWFNRYIQESIDGDLSKIPSIYFSGVGDFLVAIDKQSEQVIGCIGGQDHDDQRSLPIGESDKGATDATKQQAKYEIRRMSVSLLHQRRSIAKRLVSTMEELLIRRHKLSGSEDDQNILIYLTCSSVQRPAHKLYSRCGYKLTDVSSFGVYRLLGLSFYRYESAVEIK
jgi:GNAT superfamily N-acetyltransferase